MKTSINQLTLNYFLSKNLNCFFQHSVDSTNTWAKSNFSTHRPFALYLTDTQTHGRGRGNHSWSQSHAGETWLSTWCLHLLENPHPLFSLRVGLALYLSLEKIWPQKNWSLKAPNDIYIDQGKFSGILIEVTQDRDHCDCFIGIGANILSAPLVSDQKTSALFTPESFSTEDWNNFCFLIKEHFLILQKDPHRQNLLNGELLSLERALKKYPQNQIHQILPDGTLIMKNGQKIHWSEL